MPLRKPLFITLEGGEGTGKTTLIDRLAETLVSKGYDVVKTREPGGTRLGELIRQWLLNHDPSIHIGCYAELMLFLAARAQHIEELIEPALAAGKIVLCDRFNDSSVAYQGAARGLGMAEVQKLCELACHGVLPQLTLFCDAHPEVGLQRATAQRGEKDRIESERIAFHMAVREGLQTLARQQPDRIHTIDASQSLEKVYQDALSVVLRALEA